jgi:hypothetical protein
MLLIEWPAHQGESIMKKINYLNILSILVIVATTVLLAYPAQAYVYDDFNGQGINTSLWSDRGPMPGLFSQPGDGYLHFEDMTGGIGFYQTLRSFSRQTAPFFVSMQFSDFQAVNSSTNPFGGSGPVLIIGDGTNSIVVYEYIDTVATPPQGFRAKTTIDGVTMGYEAIPTTAKSGWLGIGYDGTQATCWYNDGTGWHQLITVNPGFANPPYFFIRGYNEYGTSLSFKVDQVQINPVPLPPGVLFQRGLPFYNFSLSPPSNLNGTSNSNRSNFAYSSIYTTTKPTTYQIGGDDFSIGSTGQTYQINQIRVWMVYGVASSQYDTSPLTAPSFPIKLWLGPEGGPIQALAAIPTLTRIWYSNGANYQRVSDGDWRAIWQVDFPVNLKIRGGQKYQFFLNGLYQNVSGNWQSPSLSTVNAALSNNYQDSPNNQYLALTMVDGTSSGTPSVVSGLDANIQILGNSIAKPASSLMGMTKILLLSGPWCQLEIRQDPAYTDPHKVILGVKVHASKVGGIITAEVKFMRFKNSDEETWSDWEPFIPDDPDIDPGYATRKWTLSSGYDKKMVYIEARDSSGDSNIVAATFDLVQ